MNVRIKTVLLWGAAIFLIIQVLNSVVMSVMGSTSTAFLINIGTTLLAAAGLAFKSANSVLEGFLEGVVAVALAMGMIAVLGGSNNFTIIVLLFVATTVGGFLASQKK